MRNGSLKISLLLGLALLSSCAKRESSAPAENQSRALLEVKAVGSLGEAQLAQETASLTCASAEDCPGNVGLLLLADQAGGFLPGTPSLGACTAALVGEDLALTNSHCIPEAVKQNPALCGERLRLILPRTRAHKEERLACRELLGSSARPTPMSPDLALFRLEKKVTRPALITRREGIADHAALKITSVTPQLASLTGVIQSQRCESAAHSYRMPVYQNEKSSVFVLGDCESVPGNSGSPVLNQKGELVGLLQAALPISASGLAEWTPHLDGAETFASLAMGTSLRCLRAELNSWQWNEECVGIQEADVAAARPRVRQVLGTAKLEQAIAEALAPYIAQTKLFGWQRLEVETKALTRTEMLFPRCVAAAEEWAGEVPLSPGENSIALRLPQIELELRFNRFLQVSATSARLGEIQYQTFRYRREELVDHEGGVLLDEAGEKLSLPACANAAPSAP